MQGKEQRRCGDDNTGVIIRKTNDGLAIKGLSLAFVILVLSVVYTLGQYKEKITTLESTSATTALKVDQVSTKVDNLGGKMDILINLSRKYQ